MSKFGNSRKANFLNSIPELCLEESDVASKCKFCLSFLDINQNEREDFTTWDKLGGALSAVNLLNKLKEFSRQPLEYWENQGPLILYPTFPKNSIFFHPKHVPHDVRWGRFRLGNKIRLAGFVVPDCLDGKKVKVGQNLFRLDKNTFYIVFLDKDHKFYKTEKP